MNFNTSILTTEQQQKLENNAPLWSQKVKNNKFNLMTLGILAMLAFVLLNIIGIFFVDWSEIRIQELVVNSIVIATSIAAAIANYIVATTMKYSIYGDRISFAWGLFKKKQVDIPFTDISAVELVEYSDKETSTIHFGTGQQYEILKMDFDNSDPRPHITFEKVYNGKEVHRLLLNLKNNAQA